MGYISYTYNFVKGRLAEYEKFIGAAPIESLEEARILLKMIEDVKDEGYTTSYNLMENDFQGVTRLKSFLVKNKFPKFNIEKFTVIDNVTYGKEQYELMSVINSLKKPKKLDYHNPFINKIVAYTKWLGSSKDTTYVFLFRDAILPYLAFDKLRLSDHEAWLIGRRFLSKYSHDLSDEDEVYDLLHDAIFETLSLGYTSEETYFSHVEEKIQTLLTEYPLLVKDLKGLFRKITTPKIMVIESGYIGTIPVLLKAIDKRVDFRVYTTIPYFYDAYKQRIFTKHFEECRLFETIQSADGLFEFANFTDGKFYVRQTNNQEVIKQSEKEIACLYELIK